MNGPTLNLAARADADAAARQLTLEILAELRADRAHSTDVLHQLMSQNRNGILETGIGKINADGWFYRDFRAPYATIALANTSVGSMTVSSAPPGPYAPTGPGSALVTGGSFQVVNLTGADGALTIYGTPGSTFNYTIFTDTQPPAAGALALVNATGQIPVAGAAGDNADGLAVTATGILRSTAELYGFNGASMDRVRSTVGSNGRTVSLQVATGTPAITSLNAAAAIVAGTAVNFSTPAANISMAVTITGGPATVTVVLEGSLDGVAWFPLATSTNVAGELIASAGKPVLLARANLTVLTGGAAPTVTAKICSA